MNVGEDLQLYISKKRKNKKQVNGEEGKHQKRPESPKTTLMKRACGGPPFQTHTQY